MAHAGDNDMSINFCSGDNRGTQIGVNQGVISDSFNTYNQNTQRGTIFNGSISAERDVHINNIINKAYHLFQSSLDAPSLFNQVQSDLGLLNSVLTLTRQRFGECEPGGTECQTLTTVLRSCDDAFADLSQIKERFHNVNPEAQIRFERFGFGVEQIQDIRAKITTNIQVLNLLISEMTRSSQTNVERLLRTFIGEIQDGKRDASRFSQASLTEDEAGAWRMIRKDLQSIGLTPDAFQKNHDFIVATLRDSLPAFGIAIPEATEVSGSLNDEVFLPCEPKHISITSSDIYHNCVYCGKGFKRPVDLHTHQKTHHPRGPLPEIPIKPSDIYHRCSHCYQVFERAVDLRNHQKTHRSRPPRDPYPEPYGSDSDGSSEFYDAGTQTKILETHTTPAQVGAIASFESSDKCGDATEDDPREGENELSLKSRFPLSRRGAITSSVINGNLEIFGRSSGTEKR